MLPDRVSNPGPLTYESDALPIALRGPATQSLVSCGIQNSSCFNLMFSNVSFWQIFSVLLSGCMNFDTTLEFKGKAFQVYHFLCQNLISEGLSKL